MKKEIELSIEKMQNNILVRDIAKFLRRLWKFIKFY